MNLKFAGRHLLANALDLAPAERAAAEKRDLVIPGLLRRRATPFGGNYLGDVADEPPNDRHR
jgi:hypothetical protein